MRLVVDGVRIDVRKTASGCFYGSSKDMVGLHLFGRSLDELTSEAWKGIRDLRMVKDFKLFSQANDN